MYHRFAHKVVLVHLMVH